MQVRPTNKDDLEWNQSGCGKTNERYCSGQDRTPQTTGLARGSGESEGTGV